MKFCTKCGTPVAGGKFCAKCGAPVNEPSEPEDKGGFFSSAGSLGDSGPARTPGTPAVAPASRPAAPVSKPFSAPVPTPDTHEVPPASAFPPSSSAPARSKPSRRISAGKELKLLLRQGVLVLLGEKRNLIISLLFPFIAAAITVWIAGKDMFVTFEATKSACFILVCAAIWGGLFNSIQSLVKERENIKRDYVSGALRIECYMASRAIIQFVLCMLQSLVLAMSIPAVEWIHGNSMPASGLIVGPVMIEFYISLFLIMYASDALGLLISSFVKKEEVASKLAPYILIAQLLFSGVLFKLEGASNLLSSVMISRWGMEALGSICDLNAQTTTVYTTLQESGVSCPCGICAVMESLKLPEKMDSFQASGGHLALVFFIMLMFAVVSIVAADILLHRVKKDGRD